MLLIFFLKNGHSLFGIDPVRGRKDAGDVCQDGGPVMR